MKRRAVQLLILIAFAPVLGAASSRAQEPRTKPAQASAEAWLSLIDNQNYAASWDTAAGAFRSAVTQEKWEAAAQAVRTPLRPMKSRVGGPAAAARSAE